MEEAIPRWTLGELAKFLNGELNGSPDTAIERPVDAGSNDPEGITFAESDKYFSRIRDSGVGAVILPPGSPDLGIPSLICASPRLAFAKLLHAVHHLPEIGTGIHETAVVHPGANIHPEANIGAYCVVENGAKIDAGARVYPFTYVGENCIVGEGSILYPHVVLVQDVRVGKNCTIHPGAVIGGDGFGYSWDGSQHQKVPQVGGVELGDRVDVGVNSAIDRATCGVTILGPGSKVDNFVQIAHNVQIGSNSVLAAHVGVAGSAVIGNFVVIGGQVGVADHVSIADGSRIAGQSGVYQSISEAGEYYGLPAIPAKRALKSVVLTQKLPELLDRIRKLEKQIEDLKNRAD